MATAVAVGWLNSTRSDRVAEPFPVFLLFPFLFMFFLFCWLICFVLSYAFIFLEFRVQWGAW